MSSITQKVSLFVAHASMEVEGLKIGMLNVQSRLAEYLECMPVEQVRQLIEKECLDGRDRMIRFGTEDKKYILQLLEQEKDKEFQKTYRENGEDAAKDLADKLFGKDAITRDTYDEWMTWMVITGVLKLLQGKGHGTLEFADLKRLHEPGMTEEQLESVFRQFKKKQQKDDKKIVSLLLKELNVQGLKNDWKLLQAEYDSENWGKFKKKLLVIAKASELLEGRGENLNSSELVSLYDTDVTQTAEELAKAYGVITGVLKLLQGKGHGTLKFADLKRLHEPGMTEEQLESVFRQFKKKQQKDDKKIVSLLLKELNVQGLKNDWKLLQAEYDSENWGKFKKKLLVIAKASELLEGRGENLNSSELVSLYDTDVTQTAEELAKAYGLLPDDQKLSFEAAMQILSEANDWHDRNMAELEAEAKEDRIKASENWLHIQ